MLVKAHRIHVTEQMTRPDVIRPAEDINFTCMTSCKFLKGNNLTFASVTRQTACFSNHLHICRTLEINLVSHLLISDPSKFPKKVHVLRNGPLRFPAKTRGSTTAAPLSRDLQADVRETRPWLPAVGRVGFKIWGTPPRAVCGSHCGEVMSTSTTRARQTSSIKSSWVPEGLESWILGKS